MSSLPTLPHTLSMQQLHFTATGEHLHDLPGDAAPLPVECYIKKTQQRQQREHAWRTYYDQMRQEGTVNLQFHKARELNGLLYTGAVMQQGTPDAPIFLFYGTQKVMELWPDGQQHAEATPVPSRPTSPPPRLRALPPGFGRSTAASPTPEMTAAGAAAAVTGLCIEEDHPRSRLRTNFARFLRELSDEALEVEFAEWQEERLRAQEHLQAIEEELARRYPPTGR
jgi:hypothetical protein